MGGANHENLGALGERLGGPTRARHYLSVQGGGDGRLMVDAELAQEIGQRLGGSLPGLIIDSDTHAWGHPAPRKAGWQAEV